MSNTIYSIILPVISQDKNKYNFVYQITEISTGMKYIGSHGTEKSNPIKDLKKYKSSTKDIWFELNQQLNPLNYYYEILSYHSTRDEATLEESRLHFLYDVKCNPKYYNKSNQTPNGFSTAGKFCAKDKDSNRYFINCDDPRYISGELVGHTKGKAVVKDKYGNNFQINCDDIRLKTGELIGSTTGKVTAKDKRGNTFSVSVNDPRLKSKELVYITTGMMPAKDMQNNILYITVNDPRLKSKELRAISKDKIHTKDKNGVSFFVYNDDIRLQNGELIPFAKGMVPVKDKSGNTFHVSKDDPRLKSKELVHITTGMVSVKDIYNNYYMVCKNDTRYINGDLIGVTGKWYIIDNNIYSYIQIKNKFNISHGILNRRCKSLDEKWKNWLYYNPSSG